MLDEFFNFVVVVISGLMNILSFNIIDAGNVHITFLTFILTCTIIPILFNFFKGVFGEVNNTGEYAFVKYGNALSSRTNKAIAYRNYKTRGGK